ncbi:MAG: hypothetical protein ABW032_00725 [Burkholderiaceae bacterium]
MARLGTHFQMLVIEEPLFFPGRPSLACALPVAGVEVLTPRTPELAPGLCGRQLPWLSSLLADFVLARGIVDPLAWLSTPAAVALLEHLEPRAVVADCLGAPSRGEAPNRELLELADVVLAADPSLAEAIRPHRPDVWCLPDEVDGAPAASADAFSWEHAAEHVLRLLTPFLEIEPMAAADAVSTGFEPGSQGAVAQRNTLAPN